MTMSARERSSVSAHVPAYYHEWTAEDEIQLFCALDGLKPIGVNKHFYMACITERLQKNLNRDIPAEAIWAHLRTLYNLDLMDDKEPLPFPNDEREFSLPESEFAAILTKKRAESEEKTSNSSSEQTNGSSASSSSAGNSTTAAAIAATSTAAATADNSTKDTPTKSSSLAQPTKDLDKKIAAKLNESGSKRTQKRTRGSISHESPSTTPPPLQSTKRRRI